MGDQATAKAESAKALKLHLAMRAAGASDAAILGDIAYDYAGVGDREQAHAAIEKALALNTGNALDYPETEQTHALILLHFGETEAMFKSLDYLLTTPDGLTSMELRLDPIWDPVRKDPRFQALLKRYP
jgi:tetratricopeptide (TPR) repeat protein